MKLFLVHYENGIAIVLAESAMLAAKQIKNFMQVKECNYRVEEIKTDKPQIIHIEEF